MKPDELFFTLDEIIEVLGRSTVIRCVSDGEGCFPGILAPMVSSLKHTAGACYAALLERKIAAYKSLLRLVRQGVFEPTSPPKKVSIESLKYGPGQP
jgi:hypothetical protein